MDRPFFRLLRRLRPTHFPFDHLSPAMGGIDPSFDPRAGANDRVRSLLPLPDGRLLVGGAFTAFNGAPRRHVARLEADGSLDLSFQPEENCCGPVFALALQPDGRILVAGWGALGTPSIARLHPDGRIDRSFSFGTEFFGYFYTLVVLPDGRLLVGGSFTGVNGQRLHRIARLLPDGGLDGCFQPGAGFRSDVPEGEASVRALAALPDGRILAAGRFHFFDEVPRAGVVRLLPDGALDPSFEPRVDDPERVNALVPLPDGGLLLGGCTGAGRALLLRLDRSGRVDPRFRPPPVFNEDVSCLVVRPDGSVVACGTMRQPTGDVYDRVVAFHPDGRPDTGFPPIEEVDGQVRCMAPDAQGRLLIGGDLRRANGWERSSLFRVRA